jgi:hypothetical protein
MSKQIWLVLIGQSQQLDHVWHWMDSSPYTSNYFMLMCGDGEMTGTLIWMWCTLLETHILGVGGHALRTKRLNQSHNSKLMAKARCKTCVISTANINLKPKKCYWPESLRFQQCWKFCIGIFVIAQDNWVFQTKHTHAQQRQGVVL